MKHLSNDEILAAVDRDTAHTAHLNACDSCRARVDELREILALTNQVEVPEPSPLFWNHFSERVRRAVAAEPEPQRGRPFLAPGYQLPVVSGSELKANWQLATGSWKLVLGALAIVVIGFAVTMRTGRPIPGGSTQVDVAATDGALEPLSAQNSELGVSGVPSEPSAGGRQQLNDDATWALLGDLASQMDWEAAGEAGLVANPGSAERALGGLSQEELRLVVELLEQEIQKSKRS